MITKFNKPMMSDKEIKIIEGLIKDNKVNTVLEFGSGGSTCYFPKIKPIKLWISIEHNGHFVENNHNLPDNAMIIWADEEWYIDSVKLGRKFDMILVDGVTRHDCLNIAFSLLNTNGFILLHDAGRVDLYPFIEEFGGKLLIDGEEPLGTRYKHRGLAIFK